ncbi:hypothetical protein QYM36_005750 [Artemia franciscana]|uniref:DDE Tnp4 domain-containing protein n=1 Tax=Artemia franciscana TaxID=6661 RepID=A0AA88I069_ARTSF|nr:hypothetical protein QYM36_005750 [Artemia franciscana]
MIAEKFGRSQYAWPNVASLPDIAAKFEQRAGFPGVVGSIDGCHIPINAPRKNQRDFLNYKRFHSILLLAIVLPDRRFSNILVGFPVSSRDSYILQRSDWFRQTISSPESKFSNSGDYHIVGDSAFPLYPWLLVPFKSSGLNRNSSGSNPNRQIIKYNKKLSQTRIVVEHTFGDIINRFRCCSNIYASVEKAVKIITASCVIHNLCIENGDLCYDKAPSINVYTRVDNSRSDPSRNSPATGFEKRNLICSQL